MKKIITLFIFSFCFVNNLFSQVFWTEDWTSGGTGWNMNVVTGTEGADPNFFTVSDAEGGGITPDMGAPTSCGVPSNGNNTMHVTSVFNPTGGAAYDAGGLCGLLFCPETSRRSESPTIDCSAKSNISLCFNYIENGDGSIDNATVWYNDGSTWIQIDDPPKVNIPFLCLGQGEWTSRTIALPASANNNPNVKIAFQWVNNDDAVGTDPSFAVDDIQLLTVPTTSAISGSASVACSQSGVVYSVTSNAGSTYAWTISGGGGAIASGQGTNSITVNWGATPNTYTITVTETNGCVTATPVTLNVNVSCGGCTPPTIIGTTVTPDTCGKSVGTITVNGIAGGAGGPYEYSKDGTTFQPSNVFANLATGSYTIRFTDDSAKICRDSVTVFVGTVDGPSISSTTPVNPTVCDSSNGSITINATGGTGTLNYSIDGGATFQASNTFSALDTGVYNIVVRDAAGCTSTTTVPLTCSCTAPTVPAPTKIDATCGNNNGKIFVTGVTGGITPYMYSNDNGVTFQAADSFVNLAPGTYSIVVKEAGNCLSTPQSVTIFPNNGPTSVSAVGTPPSSCTVNDGTITVTDSTGGGTGTPPFTFSINGVTFQSGTLFSGLGGGTYTVTVRDANGCTATSTPVSIFAPGAPTGIDTTVTNSTCGAANGKIIIDSVFNGTGPFQYSIDGGALQLADSFINLTPIPHTVMVTDANGCTFSQTVNVTDIPGPSSITATGNDESACGANDGSITIGGVSGGTAPFQYSIDGGVTYSASTTFNGLASATYTIAVKDNNGCILTSPATILINCPTPCPPFFYTICDSTMDSCFTGNAVANLCPTITPGTPPYTYLWNDPLAQTTETATNLSTGFYSVIVTDFNGCTNTVQVGIGLDTSNCKEGVVFIPNAFSPNRDKYNDRFIIRGQNIEAVKISIYNRWGQKVYEFAPDDFNDPNGGWDGKQNGTALNPGVYVYYGQVSFTDAKHETKKVKGNITLIK